MSGFKLRTTSVSPLLVAAFLLVRPAAASTYLLPAVFLQFSLGSRWNLGVGVDIHRGWVVSSQRETLRGNAVGYGPFVQAVAQFRNGGLLVAAGVRRDAGETPWGILWGTELGWVWRRRVDGSQSGHGVQVGVSQAYGPLALFALRASLVRSAGLWWPEGHLGVGLPLLWSIPGQSTE